MAAATIGFSSTAISLASAISGEAYEPSRSVLEERERLLHFVGRIYLGMSESVANFLRGNTDIAWLLIGARSALSVQFGMADVTLLVIRDPDTDQCTEKLFGYVKTALPLNDALDALDRFDSTWLVNNLDAILGRLNFDIAF